MIAQIEQICPGTRTRRSLRSGKLHAENSAAGVLADLDRPSVGSARGAPLDRKEWQARMRNLRALLEAAITKARRHDFTAAVENSQIAKVWMRDLSIHVLGQGQPEHGPAPRALNRHSISKVFRLGLLRLIGVSRQAEQDRNPGQLPHHAVTFASFPASGGIGARYPTTSSNTP